MGHTQYLNGVGKIVFHEQFLFAAMLLGHVSGWTD